MPLVYRSMKSEESLICPMVGDSGTKLGIRDKDLQPVNGMAHPNQGGMSVVSSIAGFRRRLAQKRIPPEYLPRRLAENGKIPGANGPNKFHIFRIGAGDFDSGNLNSDLFVDKDQDDHATVQPVEIVPYDQFRAAIIATREEWVSGEKDD